jgi:uncharacterized membrane protein YeaQ/YmgE (transglycosylase-associated protein family)
MNLFIWMLAGATIGWLTFTFLRWNEPRGALPNVLIGAAGGMLGGKLIAPLFTAVPLVPADFQLAALIFALVIATVALLIADQVSKRFEV